MSWNTDKEPIDYLRQRIKYYKNKMSKVEILIKDPYMLEKYGEEELRYIIARRMLTIQSYMAMYKKAVKDLETIEELENTTNHE